MFDAFYTPYAAACDVLSVAPLSQSELCTLIETLLERAGATVQ
jgi:hypothetical protein